MTFRFFFLFIGFLSFCASSKAQLKKDYTFKAYAAAGLNASQIEGDNMSGFHQFGLNAGGGVYFKMHPKWSLSTEILYSMRGANGTPYINGVPVAYPAILRINTDYLEVPVFASFHDKKYAMFGAGLSMAGLVRYNYLEQGKEMRDSSNFANLYKRYDLSLFGNVTFFLHDHIGLNFRWSYSLIPFTTSVAVDPQSHHVICIRMMYMF